MKPVFKINYFRSLLADPHIKSVQTARRAWIQFVRNPIFLLICVFASSAARTSAQYGIPTVNGPKCVPSSVSDCKGGYGSSPASSHVAAPKINSNAVIQQQVAATLASAFVQLLFSSNAEADAQKQKMMEELKARQAEAARQQQIAEAARIDAMCKRLSTKLKLSGTPSLKLKDVYMPTSSLRLKLGNDSAPKVEHPAIAYQNNGTGYAYINGQAVPQGALNGVAAQDSSAAGSPQAGSATVPSKADTAQAPLDPQKMTPQQLADSATAFDSLPPEEQQRLIDQAQQSAQLASGQPSSSAMGQLQQVASASQSAAADPNLARAAVKAGIGFDQGVSGVASTTPVAVSGSMVTLPTASASQQAAAAPSAAASPRASGSIGLPAPTPFFGSALPAPAYASQAAAPVQPKTTASREDAAPCPAGVEKLIPTRQQLQTELMVRRVQLESLRNSILRLNRTIQLDQQQFAEWEAEAQAGYDRCVKEVWDLPTQLLLNHFIEGKEAEFDAIGEKNLTAYQRQQLSWLIRAKELKSFSDFKEWALEDESRRVYFRDGLRTLVDMVPLNAGPASLVSTLEALTDNAYDYVDLASTWDRIQQLDHNSNEYLQIVRRNGEKMKELITRINQIEAQLKSAPEAPPGAPACHKVAGRAVAAR